MALSTSTILEIHQPGSDTACSGGFNPANANFDNTLSCVSGGTGSSPVVAATNYNFAAGDAGHYLFIKSGGTFIAGFYKIASVASNQATLGAACASTATVSAVGVWGLDYSRKDAARISYTDMASGGAGLTYTSAGNPVGKNIIGNLINVTAGTNFNTGFYEVSSTSGTTATVVSVSGNLTSGAGSGGTAALGGALASLPKATSLMAANLGMKCWVQYNATVYSQSTTATTGGGGGTGASLAQRIIGYYQNRGDIHMQADGSYSNNQFRPVIQLTATTLTGLVLSSFGIAQHLIFDCNSQTTSVGIQANALGGIAINCKVKNFTSKGLYGFGNTAQFEDCEVCYGTSAATGGLIFTGGGLAWKCYVHDNACPGIQAPLTVIHGCIVVNNTGASSDGINSAGSSEGTQIIGNVILANGKAGFFAGNTNDGGSNIIKNNIVGKNTAYGVRMNASVASPATSDIDGNVYWFNGTANRGFMDDTGASNAENFDTPYTNVRDVTLTADDAHNPFQRYGISGSTYSLTDLASTNGTNATPTVTSAGYSGGFVSSDVGSTIQISTQTGNWLEGVYLITSVSGGGAILDRACASAASVSGATWYFNDFRLNNTAGAGAACRKVASPAIPGGYPPTYAGGSLDYGALQHADPTSGGGCPIVGSPIVTAA